MIFHDGIEVPLLQTPQDPDAARVYSYVMRPEVWKPDTVYYDKESIVIPSMFSGFHFLAVSGGKSAAAEPEFPCEKGRTVQDGCVKWKAVPYDLYLRPGNDITGAAWSSDTAGVTISNVVTTTDKTSAMISTIPDTSTRVQVTIHFTYSNGEADDRSFIIPVAEL